jgi:hypothetical protein
MPEGYNFDKLFLLSNPSPVAGLRVRGYRDLLPFNKVRAVYSRSILQRGAGEVLLLTAKIKQNGKLYENGSRQTIQSIDDGKIRFRLGLVLSTEDGRISQGDVIATYKSQGSSKLDMIRFEDNRSLRAMTGQEDLHVGFTRHRATAKMFVESREMLRKIAGRSQSIGALAVKLESTGLFRKRLLKKNQDTRAIKIDRNRKLLEQPRHLVIRVVRFCQLSHSGQDLSNNELQPVRQSHAVELSG